MGKTEIVRAAMLAIGDELLSGRTRDRNIAYLANFCTAAGIDLREARIVADDMEAIGAAVNELRGRYDYLFTSGGIGPTHDDITADAVAAALNVELRHDPQVMKLLETHYRLRGIEFTEARKRMARLPDGATPIENPVSLAPGFTIENVHVMAGVPAIFQAMLESLASRLRTGAKMESIALDCPFPEGTIGARLAEIQAENVDVAIGSYPRYDGTHFTTQIVIRGRERPTLDTVAAKVKELIGELSEQE